MGETLVALGEGANADGTKFILGGMFYESLGTKPNGDVEIVPLDHDGRPDIQIGPRILPKDTIVALPAPNVISNFANAILGILNR